ncbi:MAG: STN and carboxypeptidase regulatory-like domain-containing protein, partial [Bacteroidota bacterium]
MQKKRCLLVSILFCCYTICIGGVPALEREITLTFNNEKLNSALNKIQEQTGLIFSYPSNILNNAPPVSLQLKQKTVREALALMLPKTIAFKAKSNYIILKEKPQEKTQKKTELSGYVYDKATEKKLANVTLYDKVTLQTVTTDEYGYYSITLPKEEQCLTVNKENYRDTCVSLTYLREGPLTNITIDPVDNEQRARDSINWRQKLRDFSQSTNDLFKRFKGYVNTINVKDTLTRNFQVSLIPFVGTNGLMSGNVYNKFSVNVFGGYSRGTRALELGGFFNIDREKVQGAQLAGFFNIVGDSMKGAQMAGFFNITGRNMNGVQLAGFLNMNIGSVKGFQGAGLLNINAKSVKGVSAAGMLNLNRFSAKGVQVAGMMNITGDTLDGVAIAGYLNLSWHSKKSLEIAALMNSARYGDHNKQISSLFNNTARG